MLKLDIYTKQKRLILQRVKRYGDGINISFLKIQMSLMTIQFLNYLKQTLPEFKIKEMHNHNLGFVAGEWIKTTFNFECNDGESILEKQIRVFRLYELSVVINICKHKNKSLFRPYLVKNVDPVDIAQAIQMLRSAGLKSTGSEIMLSNKEKTDLRYIEPALTGLANAFNVNEKFMEKYTTCFFNCSVKPRSRRPTCK